MNVLLQNQVPTLIGCIFLKSGGSAELLVLLFRSRKTEDYKEAFLAMQHYFEKIYTGLSKLPVRPAIIEFFRLSYQQYFTQNP